MDASGLNPAWKHKASRTLPLPHAHVCAQVVSDTWEVREAGGLWVPER